MSSRGRNLTLVVDEVLAEANGAARRRTAEATAIKVAAAQPQTELAREFRKLADNLRADSHDITYADLARSS